MPAQRLLIVGVPDETHVGAHFGFAARSLGIDVRILDQRKAFEAPFWLRKANWWLRGHRPAHYHRFSREVLAECRSFRPQTILCTGFTPIDQEALAEAGAMGIRRVNFLTDDPWNAAHRPSWFLKVLPHFDRVYTPRHANVEDLSRHGCRAVSYLPFGYAPEVHFVDPCARLNGANPAAESDVVFVGAADRDRLPYMASLIRAGFRVALYGGYWDRWPETKAYWRGQASAAALRSALAASKIALCLVRRANRDGNCMRTFEVPAMGGCMLTEDTADHRTLFGPDSEAVLYFSSVPEMLDKARWLLAHESERLRLAQAGHQRITSCKHTYRDRLTTILGEAECLP